MRIVRLQIEDIQRQDAKAQSRKENNPLFASPRLCAFTLKWSATFSSLQRAEAKGVRNLGACSGLGGEAA